MTATLHYIHGERGEAGQRECGRPVCSCTHPARRFLFAWPFNVARKCSPLGFDRALRALAALDDDDIGNLSEAGRRLRLQARQQLRDIETNGRLRRTGFRSMLEESSR